jgi:hypothetical protein
MFISIFVEPLELKREVWALDPFALTLYHPQTSQSPEAPNSQSFEVPISRIPELPKGPWLHVISH